MKALSVFSGGLDSMLASELIRAQGIDVLALFFKTPFFTSKTAEKSARSMGLPFKIVNISTRHLEVVKHPAHGYGRNMNPCIDCHILMFQKAGELLEKEKAAFVLSGEVIGQRPMSQNKKALLTIGVESGLDGLLLRPLSAGLLPLTIPEERGWVKRELLMSFQGRSRKPQMELATKLAIDEYPAPAGGCLLTEKVFARRLKDLITFKADPEIREIEILRLGRHFRIDSLSKLVVGRNKRENEGIRALSGENDIILMTTSVPGPTVLVSGEPSDGSLELAAAVTIAYSDARKGEKSTVRIIHKTGEKIIMTTVPDKQQFIRYMI